MSNSIVPQKSVVVSSAIALARKANYVEAFAIVASARSDESITRDQYIGAQFSLCSVAVKAGDDEAAIQALQQSTARIRPSNLRLRMMIIENALDIATAAAAKGNVLVTANAAKTAFTTAGYDDPRGYPASADRANTLSKQTRALEGFDSDVMDYFETAVRALAEADQGAAKGVLDDALAKLTNKKQPNDSFVGVAKDLQEALGLS